MRWLKKTEPPAEGAEVIRIEERRLPVAARSEHGSNLGTFYVEGRLDFLSCV
jgi:hypothetical protein